MRPNFKVEWLKLEGPRSAETCLVSTTKKSVVLCATLCLPLYGYRALHTQI